MVFENQDFQNKFKKLEEQNIQNLYIFFYTVKRGRTYTKGDIQMSVVMEKSWKNGTKKVYEPCIILHNTLNQVLVLRQIVVRF